MRGPACLFLDEVTSGLDEQTDREVMQLFRQVADGGKTVVCITHSLANVEATCHLVVILTEGGRLAFMGTPDEAKAYFGIARLGDVYLKLAERTPQEWHDRFRSSEFYQRYVTDRLPSGIALGRVTRTAARSSVPRPAPAPCARPGYSPGAISPSGRATGRHSWHCLRRASSSRFCSACSSATSNAAPAKKEWIRLSDPRTRRDARPTERSAGTNESTSSGN